MRLTFKHRMETTIFATILELTKKSTMKHAIMLKAGITSANGNKRLKILLENDLVTCQSKKYLITEKGLEYLRLANELESMLN